MKKVFAILSLLVSSMTLHAQCPSVAGKWTFAIQGWQVAGSEYPAGPLALNGKITVDALGNVTGGVNVFQAGTGYNQSSDGMEGWQTYLPGIGWHDPRIPVTGTVVSVPSQDCQVILTLVEGSRSNVLGTVQFNLDWTADGRLVGASKGSIRYIGAPRIFFGEFRPGL
jgi:hypothetical protein